VTHSVTYVVRTLPGLNHVAILLAVKCRYGGYHR